MYRNTDILNQHLHDAMLPIYMEERIQNIFHDKLSRTQQDAFISMLLMNNPYAYSSYNTLTSLLIFEAALLPE